MQTARWFSEDPEYSKITPEEKATRDRIIAIISSYSREMEGYSYFGSNPGVREDDYEDVADEIVGEGTVFFDALHRHRDGVADGMVDVDDEVFVVVAEEDGAAVGGGHHAFDGDFDDIVLHVGGMWGRWE